MRRPSVCHLSVVVVKAVLVFMYSICPLGRATEGLSFPLESLPERVSKFRLEPCTWSDGILWCRSTVLLWRDRPRTSTSTTRGARRGMCVVFVTLMLRALTMVCGDIRTLFVQRCVRGVCTCAVQITFACRWAQVCTSGRCLWARGGDAVAGGGG